MNRKFLVGSGIALAVLLGICVLLQIPIFLMQTNPPVAQEPEWDAPQTRALAQRACFDCHSNETNWAWYTRVPPASLVTTMDVIRGRNHLNFSEWGITRRGQAREGKDAREIGESILRDEMPPDNYLMMHPEARLSNAEKMQLLEGLSRSLQ